MNDNKSRKKKKVKLSPFPLLGGYPYSEKDSQVRWELYPQSGDVDVKKIVNDDYNCYTSWSPIRDPNMIEKLFKVIVIGDPTVGKTSFVQRYAQGTFKEEYKTTVGVDFGMKILRISDKLTVKLQLWDIAGQERFTWMSRVYFKDAHGAVIMFDLTNKNSFRNVVKWKKDVDSKCILPDGSSIPCILLGNKCDLSSRAVEQLDIENVNSEYQFIGWIETSVKENLMIDDPMKVLIDSMLQKHVSELATNMESIKLIPASHDNKKSFCQC